ncbi:MAG: AMP-binding protein [Dehalococcoidia bacterium]
MIIRSPLVEVTLPSEPLTTVVLRRSSELPDHALVIDGLSGRTISCGELASLVRRFAVGLRDLGLVHRDVVAICLPNCLEFAVAFLGAAESGCIVTRLNPLMSANEIATRLSDCAAKVVFTNGEPGGKVAEAAARLIGQPLKIVCIDSMPGFTTCDTLLDNAGEHRSAAIHPYDLVMLPYSSRTTGLPNGVMLTHHHLVPNIAQVTPVEQIDGTTIELRVLPMIHISGMLTVLCNALAQGATLVPLPRLEFETFLTAVERYHVTRTYLVPPILLKLVKDPAVDRADLSSLKTLVSGAAPLGPETVRAVSARIGCFVKQIYGLTETSPVTHLNPEDPARSKPHSVGQLVPNTEVRVVDPETSRDVERNELGEIWIRSPQVMQGYLDRHDATVQRLDAEGWLHTGVIGPCDEDGHFVIVDRTKELIKYNAYQVAPAELETILNAHPTVADCAVVPSTDPQNGEVPKTFVALKSGEWATARELIDFAAARVAPYKNVRRVAFADQIPKSASGKILRRLLVEQKRVEQRS